MADDLSTTAIEKRINELGPWFHNINLGGIQTAPEHFLGDYPAVKWRRFRDAVPNRACVEAVLRSAGFHIESVPKEEVRTA